MSTDAAAADRADLERRFLAGLLWCGAPSLAPLIGFDPGVLSSTARTAFNAAVEVIASGEATAPIPPDAVLQHVERYASAEVTASVRDVVQLAAEVSGTPVPRDVGRIAHALADLGAATEEAATSGPRTRLLSVADIFAPRDPVRYVCQALDFAPGAPGLTAGYGYSGKTLAEQDFAVAVATGTLAWGRFPVRLGRVLHGDWEQGEHLTCVRYQRLARARGIDPRELGDRLVVAPLPPWYLDADAGDELERLSDGMDLVVVDSFRAACPRTDENSSEARVPLDRLTRISERTGAAFRVIHHARKPTRDAPGGARMAIRGSGALYDACGSVLIFSGEKGEPVRVAHDKARISGRTHPDLLLHIEDVEIDGDPEAGLRVSATDATGEANADPGAKYAALRTKVLETVREVGTFPGGTTALRARLGANRDDVIAVVADLEASGEIRRGGTYHRPILEAVGRDSDHE